MLCYVMLCYVMLCYVMLCYVMLCYVMLCYVMLCYVMLCYVMLCYVMLCYKIMLYVICAMTRGAHAYNPLCRAAAIVSQGRPPASGYTACIQHVVQRTVWTGVNYFVASEVKDPIWHSSEWQIGSSSSEATTYYYQKYIREFSILPGRQSRTKRNTLPRQARS